MTSVEAAHCDPGDLTKVAIGEDPPTAVFDRHMRSCPSCHERLTSLREVIELGRQSRSDRAYAQPPSGVWLAVEEAIAVGTSHDEHDLPAARRGAWLWWLLALMVVLVVLAGVLLV